MTQAPIAPPTRTKSEADLLAEGWKRQFVGAPPRLQEMVELYRSLGKEVHLEPLTREELEDECSDCMLAVYAFRVVYTRPKDVAPSSFKGHEELQRTP